MDTPIRADAQTIAGSSRQQAHLLLRRVFSPLLMLALCVAILALAGWGTEKLHGQQPTAVGGYDTGSTREAAGRAIAPLSAGAFVTITNSGIEPSVLNITIGTEVTFYNATTGSCELTQRNVGHVYMPLLNRGSVVMSRDVQAEEIQRHYFPYVQGGRAGRTMGQQPQAVAPTTTPLPVATEPESAIPWALSLFGVTIPPGEHYSFVFSEPGQFEVVANVGTQWNLTITVDGETPTATATPTTPSSSTGTPTATATTTSAPDTTGTPTATPTPTTPSSSTGTPTATATRTSAPDTTGTPTATVTPTATATTLPVTGPIDACAAGSQITGETSWTVKTYPYVVNCNLTIASGVRLTLGPGVVVKMGSGGGLTVNGAFVVEGTLESPVYITSLKDDGVGGDSNNDGTASTPAPRDWSGIRISGTGNGSFVHTVVQYGGNQNTTYGFASVYVADSATAQFIDSSIVSSYGNSILVRSSVASQTTKLELTNSRIVRSQSNGIYVLSGNSAASSLISVTSSSVCIGPQKLDTFVREG